MKIKKQKKVIKQFFAVALLSIAKEMTFIERFNFVYRKKLGKSLIRIMTKQAKINYSEVLNNYKKHQRNGGKTPQGD